MQRRLISEFIGTAFLLIGVVGSGIMGAALSQGNDAVALLANAVATGCVLYVIITTLGPISGAHFNPVVTVAFALRGEHRWRDVLPYVAAQIIGGIVGVWLTHLMFDLSILQASSTMHRTGIAQWASEIIA
ncbi:MAG: glycerol uptake facilitator-like aquaporin, partial [Paracoccaceae bacterium]